jgi:hypothetical protein
VSSRAMQLILLVAARDLSAKLVLHSPMEQILPRTGCALWL